MLEVIFGQLEALGIISSQLAQLPAMMIILA
jgi:hypothetical protein